MSLATHFHFKSRAAINVANALLLARLNGSTVVSGFPKTGTTYLSHVAQFATGRTYIEGSRRLALRSSVIHCHFRSVARSAVFSYRPIDKVIASYVTHLLGYERSDIFKRLATGNETQADLDRIRATADHILTGTPRMPSPQRYYADVLMRCGNVVPVEDLAAPGPVRERLARLWQVTPEMLVQGIARADALSQDRRGQGNEFYNRPSDRIRAVLDGDTALTRRIEAEAYAVANLLRK